MLSTYIIIYLKEIAVSNNQKIVQNIIGVNTKESVIQMMFVDKNIGRIIHNKTIIHVKHTVRQTVKIY